LFSFCVDNRQARFFPKLVQLDIQAPPKPILTINTASKPEETEEIKTALKALEKIHKGILNIQHEQQRDRHRLALHSATNQFSYDHVYYGSLIETAVFIASALFQVCGFSFRIDCPICSYGWLLISVVADFVREKMVRIESSQSKIPQIIGLWR
jgi:hypothetical protein